MLRFLFLLFFLVSCVTENGELAPISGSASNTPYITSVSAVPGTFSSGETLTFIASFSKPVYVNGSPVLNFVTSTGTYSATYVSGNGSQSLIFKFPIGTGVSDPDGVYLVSPLALNSGSITSAFDGESALLSFSGTQTGAMITNGSTGTGTGAPHIDTFITPASSSQPSGFYERGMKVHFDVQFNRPVYVTNGAELKIRIGPNGSDAPRSVYYVSGSGTPTLRFTYTVGPSDVDHDGISIDSMSSEIGLNTNGSIESSDGLDADLNYSAPAAYTNVKVDGTIGPGLNSVPFQYPAPILYRSGENLEFLINFDRPVKVTGGTPHMQIKIGNVIRTASWASDGGSFVNQQKFLYSINDGTFDVDLDGIEVLGLASNSAQFVDQHGAVASINDSDFQQQTEALVATSHVLSWYDSGNPATVTTSSSSLDSFNDLMGANNGILGTTTIPYAHGYVDFLHGNDIKLSSPIPQDAYILLVYNTEASNGPGDILIDQFNNQVVFRSSGGVMATNACIGSPCRYLDSTVTWVDGYGTLTGISSVSYKKQVFAFRVNNNLPLNLQIANASAFRFYELIILDSTSTEADIRNVALEMGVKQEASF